MQLSIPSNGEKKNYTLLNHNGCLDGKDAKSAVVRICQEEDHCDNNICITFCDDRETVENFKELTTKKFMRRVEEFQKRLNLVFDKESLTDMQLDKQSN